MGNVASRDFFCGARRCRGDQPPPLRCVKRVGRILTSFMILSFGRPLQEPERRSPDRPDELPNWKPADLEIGVPFGSGKQTVSRRSIHAPMTKPGCRQLRCRASRSAGCAAARSLEVGTSPRRVRLDTAPGVPVSDPASVGFRPQTRRIGERRSALAAGSGAPRIRPSRRGRK